MWKVTHNLNEFSRTRDEVTKAYEEMVTRSFDSSIHEIMFYLTNMDFKNKNPNYIINIIDANVIILWTYKKQLATLATESLSKLYSGLMPQNEELERAEIEKNKLSNLINLYIGKVAHLTNLNNSYIKISEINLINESMVGLNEIDVRISEISEGAFPGSLQDTTKGVLFSSALSSINEIETCRDKYCFNKDKFKNIINDDYIIYTQNIKLLHKALSLCNGLGSCYEMPNFLIENPLEHEKYICFSRDKFGFGKKYPKCYHFSANFGNWG